MTATAVQIPASIRHKNPGAMMLGTSAKRFGATKSTRLGDGNTIATFPTSVDGAGALFYLLHSVYAGLSVWDALHKWGDGATLEKRGKVYEARQRTGGYVAAIERRSRFRRSDIISKEMLLDEAAAIEFAKAMAWHEAGREYPMTDAQWREAHQEFLTALNGGPILLDRNQPPIELKPLETAVAAIGEREIPGSRHNPFIVGCFDAIGAKPRDDETSWCAAFAGAILKRAGMAYIAGDAGLSARAYLKYGHALDEPEEGCLVVFWRVRPDGWQGHVAFVEKWTATTLTIVGGNQGDAVSRMTVPRTGPRSQVLGYRRPVSAVTPGTEIARNESVQQKLIGAFGAVGAFLWSVWSGIVWAATNAGEFLGLLPDAAANASSNVAAGQQITEAAGMPWPVQLGLFITVCSIAFGIYRTWRRLRPNDGALTRPPYETDEAPADTDEANDMFAANVVDLAAERQKRTAKPKTAKKAARKPAKGASPCSKS